MQEDRTGKGGRDKRENALMMTDDNEGKGVKQRSAGL